MNTIADVVSIEECLRSLCEAIVADEETVAARTQVEAFLADEEGVALYRELMTLGRELHQRDHSGQEVTDAEASRFEALRTSADAHEGIQRFNEAQEHLQSIANMINGYVTKTLQNGRIPTEEEMIAGQGGCCGGGGGGGGCGCSH